MYPHFNPNLKSTHQTITSKKAIKPHLTVKEHAKTVVQWVMRKKTAQKGHEKSVPNLPAKK
jgi:hypothetical protein